jgi:3-oxoacyl-[acyl-carrier-protein] synthase II
MQLRRVVVTGLGALTPLGNNISDYWDALVKGVSGAAPITKFDASKFKTSFACEVKNFNPGRFFSNEKKAGSSTGFPNMPWSLPNRP